MGVFRYKMMKPSGDVVGGIADLPFEDVLSAISYLEGNENTAIFVKKLSRPAAVLFKLLKQGTRTRVERKFLAEWFNNLSLMLKAGMPLATALEESAMGTESKDFQRDVSDMILAIHRGASFSEAV